ncbi:MAG: hypothetical protein D6719_05805 [Candidatus Dadabacteria bacterium]|nr:MAG: hypothetical protein D6719_05805 [Candidatus Dadabacteria bacterium]
MKAAVDYRKVTTLINPINWEQGRYWARGKALVGNGELIEWFYPTSYPEGYELEISDMAADVVIRYLDSLGFSPEPVPRKSLAEPQKIKLSSEEYRQLKEQFEQIIGCAEKTANIN